MSTLPVWPRVAFLVASMGGCVQAPAVVVGVDIGDVGIVEGAEGEPAEGEELAPVPTSPPVVFHFDAVAASNARVSASWDSDGDGCQLRLEGARVVSQIVRATGTVDIALPMTDSTPVLARLTCENAAGTTVVERSVVPVVIARFDATPPALPTSGGRASVCWAVDNADACFVAIDRDGDRLRPAEAHGFLDLDGDLALRGPFAPTDCAPVDVVATTEVELVCGSATSLLARGTEAILSELPALATRALRIEVGPAIGTLDLAPRRLASAGATHVSWSTVDVDGCRLLLDDVEVATGESGDDVEVAVTASAELRLACVDATGDVVERTARVGVGPLVTAARVDVAAHEVVVSYESEGALQCSVALEESGASAIALLPTDAVALPFERSAERGDDTAVVRCSNGRSIDELRVPFSRPVVVALTSSVDVLPPRGSVDVTLCIDAAHVQRCALRRSAPGGPVLVPLTAQRCATLPLADSTTFEALCDERVAVSGPLFHEGERAFLELDSGYPRTGAFVVEGNVPTRGGHVYATWNTRGRRSCRLSLNGRVLSSALSGREVPVRVPGPSTLVLDCEDDRGGGSTSTQTIDVGPTVTLDVDDRLDRAGLIEWSSSGADACTLLLQGIDAIDDVTSDVPIRGTRVVDLRAVRRVFVTCTDPFGGIASANEGVVYVRFGPVPPVAAGSSTTVCADARNRSGCLFQVGDDVTFIDAGNLCARIERPERSVALEASCGFARARSLLAVLGDPILEVEGAVTPPGDDVTVRFHTAGLSGCVLGMPAGDEPVEGFGERTARIVEATEVTLTCGEVVRRAAVEVDIIESLQLRTGFERPDTLIAQWMAPRATSCSLEVFGERHALLDGVEPWFEVVAPALPDVPVVEDATLRCTNGDREEVRETDFLLRPAAP